jgi:predicted dehydrogenase
VHQLEATFNVPKYQEPLTTWRGDAQESPAGGMTGLGVHMVDTMHYLVGPTKRVTAYSKRILGRWDIDDATAVVFEFASGPLGVLTTSLVLPKRCDLSVHGSEAVAWSEEDGTRVFRQRKDQASREEEPVDPLDPLVDQMAEFARCVRTGDAPETGAPEAIAVVEVLQGIIRSLKTGCSVDLAEVR